MFRFKYARAGAVVLWAYGLSGIELIIVLLVVGGLFLISLRLRPRTGNVVFLGIIAVLIVGLLSLGKLTMALIDIILFLLAVVVLLAVLLIRGLSKAK